MDGNGLNILHYFVNLSGNRHDYCLKRIRKLLTVGSDPNQQDDFGNTPLHTAAGSTRDNIGIIQELINAGADVNLTNSRGFTPLHYATMRQKPELVKVLLQSGADINAGTHSGTRALHYAINNCGYEFLRHTRFHEKLAPFKPDLLTIKMLLQDKNIDVNAVGIYGETPLMWAVTDKQILAVKALLGRGANPNVSNVFGQSPLHMVFAAARPCIPIAHLLLQHGANVSTLDGENQTPIDILIDGIGDGQSLRFAKQFIKMAAFQNNISKKFKLNLGRHPELSVFQETCSGEVEQMKNEVISHNLTVYDFLLDCFNEEQFEDLLLDIYKPLVDILLKGCYSVYLHDILRRIEKFELWRVLKYNLYLQNKAVDITDIERMEFIRKYINCELTKYVSHWDLFLLILSYSNSTDNEISNINNLSI